MEYIVFTLLLILAFPLALYIIFKPVMDDKKVRHHIENSDLFNRHYCFLLTQNQTDAIRQLSIHNIYDTLEYKFDADQKIIVFFHSGASIQHQISFFIFENKTYLKVSRVRFLHSKSNIPYKINKFFMEKIGAVPVDYSYFESTIAIPKS